MVYQFQFHVGDDDTICKDWEALNALECFALPWAPWDNATPSSFIALSLPTLRGPPLIEFPDTPGQLLCAPFDHAAVNHYFADFLENSEDAFLRSHIGPDSAVMLNTIKNTTLSMADRLLDRVIENGNMDVLLERLRACGRDDLVEKLLQ